MSKVFKRPMFRKGGPINNGIMTGIVDREMHAENPIVGGDNRVKELTQRNLETLMQNMPESKAYDPLTTFLLQYGPALASARPTGNIIGTAVGAAAQPIQTMLEEQAAQRKYQRDLKAGATQLAIEQAGKEALLEKELASKEAIAQKQLEAMGGERLQSLTDKYFSVYNDAILAGNRAKHDIDNIPGQIRDKYGKDQYGGLIEGGDIEKQAQTFGRKGNQGKVFFDITDGKSKRLRKDVTGKYVWEEVSLLGEVEEGVKQPGPGDTGVETPAPPKKEIPETKFRTMEEYQDYLKREQEKLFEKVPVEELGTNISRAGRG